MIKMIVVAFGYCWLWGGSCCQW